MSEHPNVSIIIIISDLCFSHRKSLDNLISHSVVDMELILIDKVSTDTSSSIALEYVRNHPGRIKYYKSNINKSAEILNYGFSLSHGEYVAFVDSDDYVEPDIYRLMYEKAIEDNSDIVCCGYDYISSLDDNPDQIQTIKSYRFYAMHHSGHSIQECPPLLTEVSCFVWNKLFRRELLEYFTFPANLNCEDNTFLFALMEMANRISIVNKVGYFFRIQRSDAFSLSEKDKYVIIESTNNLLQYYLKNGKIEVFRDELNYICYRHLLHARKKQLKKAPLSFIFHYSSMAFSFLRQNCPSWRNNKYLYQDYELNSPKYELEHLYNYSFFFVFHFLLIKIQRILKRTKRKLKRLTKKALLFFNKRDDQPSRKGISSKASKSSYSLEQTVLLDIQAIQRDILGTIHRFCIENGLHYYAAEGSLLGAVRHQGFIPWDDDMDLAMPRSDYETFIRLWGKQMIDGRIMLSSETWEDYYLPFIKIIQYENVKYRETKRKVPPELQGSSIDIFPLDETPAFDNLKELRRFRKIRLVRDMMLYKVGSIGGRLRKLKCLSCGVLFRSMPSLQKKLKKLCTCYQGRGLPYLANLASSYSPKKEIFLKEWLGTPREGKFDDTVIMLPEKAENILNTIYGAYEEFPPESKQVCKHHYERVKNT